MPGLNSRSYSKADQVGKSRHERKQEARTQEAAEMRACYARVDERDERRCRVCQRMGNPHSMTLLERLHRHHLIYRSRGGAHIPSGVASVCARCHA